MIINENSAEGSQRWNDFRQGLLVEGCNPTCLLLEVADVICPDGEDHVATFVERGAVVARPQSQDMLVSPHLYPLLTENESAIMSLARDEVGDAIAEAVHKQPFLRTLDLGEFELPAVFLNSRLELAELLKSLDQLENVIVHIASDEFAD